MKLTRLRDVRELHGWSQSKLAEESGVSRDGISNYETGHREAWPSTARKLADALGVEIADLVTRNEELVGAGKVEPAVPLDKAPREAGQRKRERSALEVAREAGRKQYEMDQKAGNRVDASEGIPQAYFARASDEALFGDLRHRHPDELADALLDSERDAARLKEENARLRHDLAEYKAEAEREQETAR